MFHGRDWDGVSRNDFMKLVGEYFAWFLNERINTAQRGARWSIGKKQASVHNANSPKKCPQPP